MIASNRNSIFARCARFSLSGSRMVKTEHSYQACKIQIGHVIHKDLLKVMLHVLSIHLSIEESYHLTMLTSSGVARILKLPGHRNCMLPKAAHRGV